jgi:hypothetical protein
MPLHVLDELGMSLFAAKFAPRLLTDNLEATAAGSQHGP